MGWRKDGGLPKKQRVTIVVDSELNPAVAKMIHEIPYGCINKTIVALLEKAVSLADMPQSDQLPPSSQNKTSKRTVSPSVKEVGRGEVESPTRDVAQAIKPATPEPTLPDIVPPPKAADEAPPRPTRDLSNHKVQSPPRGRTPFSAQGSMRDTIPPVSRGEPARDSPPPRRIVTLDIPTQSDGQSQEGFDLETARLILGMNE